MHLFYPSADERSMGIVVSRAVGGGRSQRPRNESSEIQHLNGSFRATGQWYANRFRKALVPKLNDSIFCWFSFHFARNGWITGKLSYAMWHGSHSRLSSECIIGMLSGRWRNHWRCNHQNIDLKHSRQMTYLSFGTIEVFDVELSIERNWMNFCRDEHCYVMTSNLFQK